MFFKLAGAFEDLLPSMLNASCFINHIKQNLHPSKVDVAKGFHFVLRRHQAPDSH